MSNFLVLVTQVAVIFVTGRVVAMLLSRAGQAQVFGQTVAVMLLGPSVLGQLSLSAYGSLFASSTQAGLTVLSQVSVLCFVGFRWGLLRSATLDAHPESWRQARSATDARARRARRPGGIASVANAGAGRPVAAGWMPVQPRP